MLTWSIFFPSAWHLAELSALHLLSVRVHVWCREGREMQPCRFAWIRHCSILQCVRDCPPSPLQLHPTLLLHHLHAHTYATRAHPAYWSVTMETERLLPKRGGVVMEAAEERRKWTFIHPPVHESATLIIEVTLFKRQILHLGSWMNAVGGAFIYYLLKKIFSAQCFC